MSLHHVPQLHVASQLSLSAVPLNSPQLWDLHLCFLCICFGLFWGVVFFFFEKKTSFWNGDICQPNGDISRPKGVFLPTGCFWRNFWPWFLSMMLIPITETTFLEKTTFLQRNDQTFSLFKQRLKLCILDVVGMYRTIFSRIPTRSYRHPPKVHARPPSIMGCRFGPESKPNPGNQYKQYNLDPLNHLWLCFRKCIGDKSATSMLKAGLGSR